MSRIKKGIMKSLNSAKSQLGVGLVEFMVASTVGLVLLAGAANVMLATYDGKRDQQRLDQMQENFRYASNVILRVVRQGRSFANPNSESEESERVMVEFSDNDESTHDCLGNPTKVPNTFFVDDQGRLICNVKEDKNYALAEGFDAPLKVEYGVDSDNDGIIDKYVGKKEVADWGRLNSARITLTSYGRSVRFVATMRQKSY